MRSLIVALVVLVTVTSCSSGASESDVQTAIAATETARPPTRTPTNTPLPSATPIPTFTPRPTPTDTPEPEICADQYFAAMNATDLLQRWDDAADIAGSTGRINLSGPVGDLQAIRREAGRLDIPFCAEEAHEHLLRSMELYIDAFLAFMAQDPDSIVDRRFEDANEALDEWGEAVDDLRLTPMDE